MLIILLLLLLPTQYLMFKGYKSLDGRIHAERISQFHEAINLGQFPVRLAPSLIEGIGYPLFVVNYQLPYYFAEPFMLVKNDAMFAYKMVMAVSYLLSGIILFFLFREVDSGFAALTGAVIFSYLPYRFGDLYMRGAFGELVSMMFVPAVLLAMHKVTQGNKLPVLFLALSVFGLITSHTVIFLMFSPLLLFYIPLILKPKMRQLKLIIVGIIFGILLSSFQLLPAIVEKSFMKFDQRLVDLYPNFFVNIFQLLRIPKVGINTGTYFQIGIVSTLVIVLSMVLFLIKRNSYVLFFLFFALISIILTQEASSWFWKNIPLMSYILYPYRFLLMTILSVAFLGVFIVNKSKPKLFIALILIFLTIYTNRHFIKIAPWFEIRPPANLTTQDEYDTIWSNEETFKLRPLVISSGNEKIDIFKNEPFKVSFEVQVEQPADITVRKMYFPGWRAKVNNNSYPINIKNGLISLELHPGNSKVDIFFAESLLRKVANLITLFSFLILIAIFIRFQTLSKT